MCTLSWLLHSDGFEVFFNRDERKSRPLALPPAYHAGPDAIYPIDPEGEGTWLALKGSGDVYCLLNNYQAQQPMENRPSLQSRGGVIVQLLSMEHGHLNDRCQSLSLDNYAPFIICHFPSELTSSKESATFLSWDGHELLALPLLNPVISSAVGLNQVFRNRARCFEQAAATSKAYLDVHSSHSPSASQLSVCMHRHDAETVSLSHVKVTRKSLSYRYYHGSPCRSDSEISELTLSR